MSKTYKCVPVPTTIKIGKKDSHLEAVGTIQAVLNKEAAGDWRYVGIDSISSEFEPGCIGGLLAAIPIINMFFRGEEAVVLKFFVFEKDV